MTGYAFRPGDVVEAVRFPSGEWHPGVVAEVDYRIGGYIPYLIEFSDSGDSGWRWENEVRAPQPYSPDLNVPAGTPAYTVEPSGAISQSDLDAAIAVTERKGSDYVVKDSGAREERGNGFVRDTEDGKVDWTAYVDIEGLDLIPPHWIKQLADHMLLGVPKYGRDNWKRAREIADVHRFNRSEARHARSRRALDYSENQAAATVFNVFAAEDTHVRALGGDPEAGDTVKSMLAKKVTEEGS